MKMGSARFYAIAVIIFLASFAATVFLPILDVLRVIYAVPGAAALVGVIYQALRDKAAHDRALELQKNEQQFSLGVASHMARVAFDKHVQFCEAYLGKMSDVVTDLFEKGPTRDCLKSYEELTSIRRSFVAWLTKDFKEKIAPFEKALLKIGSTHVGLEHLPRGDERSEKVALMYRVYSELLGIQVDESNEKATPDLVLKHLQELLGVEQLNRLRAVAIARAIADLEK